MSAENEVIDDFRVLARKELASYLSEVGLLIYTPASTFRQNDVIYWGFNPGQSPDVTDCTHWTIEKSIDDFEGQPCKITQESWPNTRKGTDKNGYYIDRFPGGKAPYQLGVRHLLGEIGHADALVSNFIFLQTSKAKDLDKIPPIFINHCLCVHQFIFDVCKPKILITTKGVIEKWQHGKLQLPTPANVFPSGYARWKCKIWREIEYFGHKFSLIQTPHMSYWNRVLLSDRPRPAATDALVRIRREVSSSCS